MKYRSRKKKVTRPHPDEGNNEIMRMIICIFLVVSTFVVYSQAQDHEFLNYDDNVYITENSHVKSGLTHESIVWAFTTDHDGNWFPLTWLSHMLDYQLYGSNPEGHHLTNLLFHIISTLLLFMVLMRMTGTLWQSGFVATLFALHPLHVESVAWAAERKDVLSTFFWMLTIWAYIRYVRKTGIKRYLLVVLFFALGLMSKPMLITLPFVILLLDYWPLGRFKLKIKKEESKSLRKSKHVDTGESISQLICEKLPLLILSAGSSITTFIVQKSGGAVQSADLYPLQARIINALVSYLEYLEKMVWPKGLAILYPHPGNALPVWKGVACGIVLVCITTVVVQMVHRVPYLAVGWFWYLGTLVPVIGIVQVGWQGMADRYTYIPLIGIFIIVAWGLPELMAKWRHRDKVLTIAAGILIPTLMAMTWIQVSHWRNSITIFKHAVRVTDEKYPTFAIAYYNLGNILFATKKYEEAITYYKMAIKLKPDYVKTYYNLGNILFATKKYEEAITYYKMAIKLKPDFAPTYNNLGNALSIERKTEEAISHYKMAIKLKPDYAGVHDNLGNALMVLGRTKEADHHLKMARDLEKNLRSDQPREPVFPVN